VARVAVGELPQASSTRDPTVVNVNGAAEYMGVSITLVRRLVAERRIVFYKLGSRVTIRKLDLDQFIEDGKREVGGHMPYQLRDRRGRSPRKTR
jgi:excisionase family DNA binding protein